MAQITFGKLDSWYSEGGGGNGAAFDKDDFLNMREDGKYLLRIAQEGPCIFAIHWGTDVQGRARRVNCAVEGCALCAEANKPQPKYIVAAINRERGRVQLVEFGKQVYNQIVNLRKDKDWGDPRNYDIKIDKDRSRGISNTYIVTAVPRNIGPISPDEALMVKDFLARVKVENFAKQSTNEEILRKLGRSEVAPAQPNANWKTQSEGSPAAATKVAANIAEDDDFDFN